MYRIKNDCKEFYLKVVVIFSSLMSILVLLQLISCNSKERPIDYQFLNAIGNPKDIIVGTISVPENYSDTNGKKIAITYAILKAKNPKTNLYPILHFSGGPGGESLSSIGRWVDYPLRENRDFIIFDQRGIGHSSAMPNLGPSLFRILAMDIDSDQELMHIADTVNHYKQLCSSSSISVDQYNTLNNASDVKQLMEALGYEKYNLFGESYGTRLARYVMDIAPEVIANVILDAPAVLEDDFLTMRLEHYNNALEKIFAYHESKPILQDKYPELRKTYFELLNQLKENPIKITLDSKPFIINPQDALYLLRYQLYRSDAKLSVATFINDMKARNVPKLDSALHYIPLYLQTGNHSVFLSTERHEEFNNDLTPAFLDSLHSSLPNIPIRLAIFSSLHEAAKNWHSVTMPMEDKNLESCSIPVLIFSNKYDPVTPPENAFLFKNSLPKSKVYILELEGHGVGVGCETTVMADFLKNPSQFSSDCLRLANN